MATLLTPDGNKKEVLPANGKTFDLKEMYKHCECDIVQFIYHPDGRILIMDEEAKLRKVRPALNHQATRLGMECGMMPNDYILGPVLVCSPTEAGEGVEDEEEEEDDYDAYEEEINP